MFCCGGILGCLCLGVGVGAAAILVSPSSLRADGAEETDVDRNIRTATHYIDQHDYPQALAYMQRALRDDPESARANSGMGNLYAGMHQYEKAIPYLEKALHLDPTDPTVFFGLGACYMDLQQHEQAIPYLEQLVKMRPRDVKPTEMLAVAYVRRGATFGKQGKNPQAKAAIQAAVALFQRTGNTARVNELTAMLKAIPSS